MNNEQASKWKALQGGKKGGSTSFYTIGLWVILIFSLLNGFFIGTSAVNSGISFIITALMFCTLAIRAKISDIENVIRH